MIGAKYEYFEKVLQALVNIILIFYVLVKYFWHHLKYFTLFYMFIYMYKISKEYHHQAWANFIWDKDMKKQQFKVTNRIKYFNIFTPK